MEARALPFERHPYGFEEPRGLLPLVTMVTMRKQINLRLSEEFLAQLDEVRGGVPREAWIRRVLMEAVKEALRDGRGGAESD